jgi:hypothetical protein
MMNSPRYAPRNVIREVEQLSATGFERYIADRFSDIGWFSTEQAHRNSFDVEAVSLSGKRYLLEVKYKELNDDPTPLSAVRQILPAKLSLAPDAAIVVTSSPKGFTKDAQGLARQHGILLWTLTELQVLADAGASGDHNQLESIGLEAPLAPQTLATPIAARPPPKTAMWFEISLGMVALVGLIAVIWFLLPKQAGDSTQTAQVLPAPQSTSQTNNSNGNSSQTLPNPQAAQPIQPTNPLQSTSEIEAEIRSFLNTWDQSYQAALTSNDASSLLAYVNGEQKTGILERFASRQRSGCVLRIDERSPSEQGAITLISANQAKTFMIRNAKYIETCPDKPEKVLRDGQTVKVTYELEKVGDGWQITDSVTTGGEIKVIAAPAKPKNPVLQGFTCNGDAFAIAGREQYCNLNFRYTPVADKALMYVTAEVWIDLYDGGVQNKFVVHTGAWSKENSTLQPTQLERDFWQLDLPFEFSLRENTGNFSQYKLRSKLVFQYADNSAFRGEYGLDIK